MSVGPPRPPVLLTLKVWLETSVILSFYDDEHLPTCQIAFIYPCSADKKTEAGRGQVTITGKPLHVAGDSLLLSSDSFPSLASRWN